MTVGEFVEGTYRPLHLQGLKPGTVEKYESILDLYVVPFFGATPLAMVTGTKIREFVAHLAAEGVTKPKGYVSQVTRVLGAAVDDGKLAKLPDGIPKYSNPKKIPGCPSIEDIQLLQEFTTGWLRLCVALMWYGGLRTSEARALQVRDVDLREDELWICRTFSGDKNGGVLVDTTKGGADRIVRIHRLLRPLLVPATRNKQPTEPILVTGDGNIPRRQHIYSRLTTLQRRAGLYVHGGHEVRHAFCSSLLNHGVGLEAVRVLAGHQDIRTTARYLHANRKDLADAIDTIPG